MTENSEQTQTMGYKQRPSLLDAHPRGARRQSKATFAQDPSSRRRSTVSSGGRRKSLSLGDRVEHSKKSVAFPKKGQLWVVCMTLLLSLISIYTVSFFVNDAVMKPRDPKWRSYEHPADVNLDNDGPSYVFAGSSPVSKLDDKQFTVYLAIFLAGTILLAGLGLELLVWISFLKNGWSDEFEHLWKFAQFAFPLLVTAAVGMALHNDYMAMVLLVPGLWKFGCPETFMYMYSAIYNSKHSHSAGRIADFLNGLGTAVHHSAAAFFVTVFLAGVVTPTPASIGPVLVLLMQHWFALLHYVNPTLYMLIELLLEAFFEWNAFSNFHENAMTHWSLGLTTTVMVSAHWMYLSAAFLELVGGGVVEEGGVAVQLSQRQLEIDEDLFDDDDEEEEMLIQGMIDGVIHPEDTSDNSETSSSSSVNKQEASVTETATVDESSNSDDVGNTNNGLLTI